MFALNEALTGPDFLPMLRGDLEAAYEKFYRESKLNPHDPDTSPTVVMAVELDTERSWHWRFVCTRFAPKEPISILAFYIIDRPVEQSTLANDMPRLAGVLPPAVDIDAETKRLFAKTPRLGGERAKPE